MEWQVDELQSGMKIQDLQANPPGSKGVKNIWKLDMCLDLGLEKIFL